MSGRNRHGRQLRLHLAHADLLRRQGAHREPLAVLLGTRGNPLKPLVGPAQSIDDRRQGKKCRRVPRLPQPIQLGTLRRHLTSLEPQRRQRHGRRHNVVSAVARTAHVRHGPQVGCHGVEHVRYRLVGATRGHKLRPPGELSAVGADQAGASHVQSSEPRNATKSTKSINGFRVGAACRRHDQTGLLRVEWFYIAARRTDVNALQQDCELRLYMHELAPNMTANNSPYSARNQTVHIREYHCSRSRAPRRSVRPCHRTYAKHSSLLPSCLRRGASGDGRASGRRLSPTRIPDPPHHPPDPQMAKGGKSCLWALRDNAGVWLSRFGMQIAVVDERTFTIETPSPTPMVLLALPAPVRPAIHHARKRDAMNPARRAVPSRKSSAPARSASSPANTCRAAASYMRAIQATSLDLLPLLRKQPHLLTRSLTTGGLIVDGPNHLFPPFNDPRARQALLAMVNQPDYMELASGGNTPTRVPASRSWAAACQPVPRQGWTASQAGLREGTPAAEGSGLRRTQDRLNLHRPGLRILFPSQDFRRPVRGVRQLAAIFPSQDRYQQPESGSC